MEEDYWFDEDILEGRQLRQVSRVREDGLLRGRGEAVSLDRESVIADILSKPRALVLILELIERPKTVAELCEVIKAGESTIRHYVNTLSKVKLLMRVRGVDGRKKYVKLTSEGRSIAKSVLSRFNKCIIKECLREVQRSYYGRSEELIDSSCVEELLDDVLRDPIKLLQNLGYKEEGYGFLVPPKDLMGKD